MYPISGFKASDQVQENTRKASRVLEAERTRQYVSITMRGPTPPLSLRWGFETNSKKERPHV